MSDDPCNDPRSACGSDGICQFAGCHWPDQPCVVEGVAATTLDNGGWREDVEARLDTVTNMVELNAEEPWEAEVHGLLCKAWRIMVDHREAKPNA